MLMSVIKILSNASIPFMILVICLIGYVRGVKIYDAFIDGAKEGLATAVRILPFLVAMFVAIGIFRASGAMSLFTGLLSPIARLLGISRDLLPLAIIRPLSGTGSLEVLSDILKVHGPDSLTGRMASVMQASCETTFYVLTVYFGAVGIKKIRHTLLIGLMADILAFAGAVLICRAVFAAP
ncbi:MAG TPA: spore maturation protein [Firmicutes bacterium]|nr:spore maturation protein [Bacillota bacterium]